MAIQIQKYRSLSSAVDAFRTPCAMEIPKAEGIMRAEPGDWIIIDEAGEQHQCTPDVFAKTYQLVADGEEIPAAVSVTQVVAAEAGSAEETPACGPVAEASIHDCPVEDALDVLIERLADGATDDRERALALSRLEEARFWLHERTRKRVDGAWQQLS